MISIGQIQILMFQLENRKIIIFTWRNNIQIKIFFIV
jgi:hypothetical protein